MEIDVCIIAGRRPELLQQTIESFRARLFDHFTVARLLVNIDPVFGGPAEERACVEILRAFRPDVSITTPAAANFCRAVAGTWARSGARYLLHLEDDWLINEPFGPADLEAGFRDPRVRQLSFLARERGWRDTHGDGCDWRRRRVRLFGLRLPFTRSIPRFTTSPSFIEGDFARAAAALLDDRYDPEKQFSIGVNPPLERLARRHLNRIVSGREGFLITDTGRDWRAARGIEKQTRDGKVIWTGLEGGDHNS